MAKSLMSIAGVLIAQSVTLEMNAYKLWIARVVCATTQIIHVLLTHAMTEFKMENYTP